MIEKLSLSPSNYSLGNKDRIWRSNVFTTTSTKLLYWVLYFGATVCFLSVLTVGYYLARYLTHSVGVDGFTSIIVSVWFFGGATLMILGILGLYIGNILAEVRQRPYTHLRAVHRVNRATLPVAQKISAD